MHNEYAMIDSTIVRAHQHSVGEKAERNSKPLRSKGGLSTRIHAEFNALATRRISTKPRFGLQNSTSGLLLLKFIG